MKHLPFKTQELVLLNVIRTIQERDKKHIVVYINTATRLLVAQKNVDVPNLDKLIERVYEVAEAEVLTERMKESDLEKMRTC